MTTGADEVIDADGCAVLPGFIQTHIHLCQTLFRGSADDLSLIDWLKKRIWPMEAAHTRGINSRIGTTGNCRTDQRRNNVRADNGNCASHRRSLSRR